MMAKTFLDNVTLHIRHMLGHLCSLIEPVARLYCPLAPKVDVYLRKETEEEVQFFWNTAKVHYGLVHISSFKAIY